MKLQSKADIRLLNGLLPVSSVFNPLFPVLNVAQIHTTKQKKMVKRTEITRFAFWNMATPHMGSSSIPFHWFVSSPSPSSCLLLLSTSTSCTRFESWLGHRLSSLRTYVVSLRPSMEALGQNMTLRHYLLLPHPFPFIIQYPPYRSALQSLSYWQHP